MLAARIRQLERKPEDVERATRRMKEALNRNKARFYSMHRLRPTKIEEGDWVLVYDSSFDNQHRSTHKFAKRLFGAYVETNTNDNVTYHLTELDGTIAIQLVGKYIKVFKKRHEAKPDPTLWTEGDFSDEEDK